MNTAQRTPLPTAVTNSGIRGHVRRNTQAGRSRGAGWDYVHVAIDDHSRVSHATIWPDETAHSAVHALVAALRHYRGLGVQFERVLTDNSACYKSAVFAKACRRFRLKHKTARPYTPRTNGKAERLIQTALHEWAYARAYDNADQGAAHLPHWLHDYNWHRPHASLDYRTPISNLGISVNNLVGLHSYDSSVGCSHPHQVDRWRPRHSIQNAIR